ncbi:MAG: hypothetical protein ACKPKO_14825, partial [Candidatus Fonsibacter sp.]
LGHGLVNVSIKGPSQLLLSPQPVSQSFRVMYACIMQHSAPLVQLRGFNSNVHAAIGNMFRRGRQGYGSDDFTLDLSAGFSRIRRGL